MIYAIYDPRALKEALRRTAKESDFLYSNDTTRPVLYFYASIPDKAYRPSTSIKTYSEPPNKDDIDAFEANNGVPRLLFNAQETRQLLAYCQKKNPAITLKNLPDFFKESTNGLNELQNCFGVEEIAMNRKHRLSALLDQNIDLRKMEKGALPPSNQASSRVPKPK